MCAPNYGNQTLLHDVYLADPDVEVVAFTTGDSLIAVCLRHTTKAGNTHGNAFAVCHTRQRAHGGEMHGNVLFAVCHISWHTAKTPGGPHHHLTTVADGDGRWDPHVQSLLCARTRQKTDTWDPYVLSLSCASTRQRLTIASIFGQSLPCVCTRQRAGIF